MAWFRRMGIDEVAYHAATVVGRADDYPGQALDYYGSRGETPLRWGGEGAARLGLVAEVTPEGYEAAFGPGGFRDPVFGDRLVSTQRPGMELVVAAHKTVAVLGVIGRADDMHAILDAERDATMACLDDWFRLRGGRRGRAQSRCATSGLVYATTRHATSRSGDPAPHDHVLVANVYEMLDAKGGFKALDTGALRDTVEAATMVGRQASAAKAIELGYTITADDGPSGRLRHWRIAGIPDEVCEVFSKRADDIAEHLAESGYTGYRAANVAARATRTHKRHTPPEDLLQGWQAELDAVGWPAPKLGANLDLANEAAVAHSEPLTDAQVAALTAELVSIDGALIQRHKAFTRTNVIAELAPRLYGHQPDEVNRVVDRVLAHAEVIPLLKVEAAREQAYTAASVLATEQAIAATVERLTTARGAGVAPQAVAEAVADTELVLARPLTAGQCQAVTAVCGSGRGVDVLVGVAGAGKTTALDTAAAAFETAGYRVLGTATSGQAARTLGSEAHIESRTLTSLLWRLDHGQVILDPHAVVVLDEAGMTADAALLRLVTAVEVARTKLVIVGDHRQLSAIGPGGALAAMLHRHPDAVTVLDTNVRQTDPAERAALAELRDGSVPAAVDWYAHSGRITIAPNRTRALAQMVDAWAQDLTDDHHPALLAWRRADVTDLNRLARARWDQLGHLGGPELEVDGGRRYAAGDLVVILAPNPDQRLVTSERATVTQVDPPTGSLQLVTGDGRTVRVTGQALGRDRLDHGYAVTVHRAQGATYQSAHVLAAGGGRELGYVAMSRARAHTQIHAVADTVGQAVEDIAGDWQHDRHQRWIIDTTTHAPPELRARPAAIDETVRQATLRAEHQALLAIGPPDPHQARLRASSTLHDLERLGRELRTGTGRWLGSAVGQAARTLQARRQDHEAARRAAGTVGQGWRQRRRTQADLQQATNALDAADADWRRHTTPIETELQCRIDQARLDRDRTDLTAFGSGQRLYNDRLAAVEQALGIEPEQVAETSPERLIDRSTSVEPPDLDAGMELGW